MKIKDIFEYEVVEDSPHFEFVQHPDGSIIAIDSNTYDGAPDGNRYMGYGKTKQEAVTDLCDRLVPARLYSEEAIDRAEAEFMAIMSQGEMEQARRDGVQDERPRVEH